MALICRKLRLQPGLAVLDIGCGFGGLMKYMRDEHGVHVTGLTLSKEQQRFADERFDSRLLLFCDYRKLDARYEHSFDRVVSVGMLEHVGYKNYPDFFRFPLLEGPGTMFGKTMLVESCFVGGQQFALFVGRAHDVIGL